MSPLLYFSLTSRCNQRSLNYKSEKLFSLAPLGSTTHPQLEGMGHFPFLQLPREIRDNVYEYVVESNAEPPKSPKDLTLSDRCEFEGIWGQNAGTMVQKNSLAKVTCHGLLFSNRQVSEELRHILSYNGTTGKLDCMAVDLRLWATWTLLPLTLEYLQVNFRIFNCVSIQWCGDGGRGLVAQHLLGLVGGFFEFGPRFFGKPLNRGLCLENEFPPRAA